MARCRRSAKLFNAHRPWSKDDDITLVSMWAEFHIETISAKLGRSLHSVRDRTLELHLGGAQTRYLSIDAAAKETGYNRTTIIKVAAHLGLPLHPLPRTTPKGHLSKEVRRVIEREQLEKICEFLREELVGRNKWRPVKNGRWGEGSKPAACLDCSRDDRRHAARGLCITCYERRRTAERRAA
jgi:hypothetical protein